MFLPVGYQYGRSRSLLSSPTILLIIANVFAYIVLVIVGDPAYYFLGQQGQLFFRQHFYWQLFTSLFVHFDIFHILFNMYGLYYFGRLTELRYSDPQYLALYFGAGLFGNIMSLYLIPLSELSGGASGAIFGLVGSYVASERKMQHLGAALIYAAAIFVLSSGPHVNIFAHLFGLVGGLVLGLLFSASRKPIGYTVGYSYTA